MRKKAQKPINSGVFQDGEKGWSSDQVGNPQPDREGNVPVTQERVSGVRVPQWRDQEEPALPSFYEVPSVRDSLLPSL